MKGKVYDIIPNIVHINMVYLIIISIITYVW